MENTKLLDKIYFDATTFGICILDYTTNGIAFGLNKNHSRKNQQRTIVNLCSKFDSIKNISFIGDNAIVEFENVKFC